MSDELTRRQRDRIRWACRTRADLLIDLATRHHWPDYLLAAEAERLNLDSHDLWHARHRAAAYSDEPFTEGPPA